MTSSRLVLTRPLLSVFTLSRTSARGQTPSEGSGPSGGASFKDSTDFWNCAVARLRKLLR